MVELYLLPFPKEMMKKVFRGALITTTPESFSIQCLLSGFMGGVAGIVLSKLFLLPIYILSPIFFAIFYSMTLLYPFAKLKSRKGRIDMKLPHAITYMQSLCKSIPLF